MERSGYRKSWTKNHEAACTCGHERIAHYTREGNCVVEGCSCATFKAKGRQPFQNKRAKCSYGHAHDSGTEIKACFDLHCQKLAGAIKSFTAQRVVSLIGPSGAEVGTYKIDFEVTRNDGSIEYVEAKGDHLIREPLWRLKWALLQDQFKGRKDVSFRVVRG